MEILFLLIPLSVVLVLMIMGVFAWALNSGQFDDVEREGLRILEPDDNDPPVDPHVSWSVPERLAAAAAAPVACAPITDPVDRDQRPGTPRAEQSF